MTDHTPALAEATRWLADALVTRPTAEEVARLAQQPLVAAYVIDLAVSWVRGDMDPEERSIVAASLKSHALRTTAGKA